jgi:hypothetical protein
MHSVDPQQKIGGSFYCTTSESVRKTTMTDNNHNHNNDNKDGSTNYNSNGDVHTNNQQQQQQQHHQNLPQSRNDELPWPRSVVGTVMEKSSDIINDHLIVARMAAFSSIVLLTAFGLANTPLFFRYRTVSEIPILYFQRRKRLYGRIMSVPHHHHHHHGNGGTSYNVVGPIQVMVRHLSPMGLLLPTPWYDFLLKIHPFTTIIRRPFFLKHVPTLLLPWFPNQKKMTRNTFLYKLLVYKHLPLNCHHHHHHHHNNKTYIMTTTIHNSFWNIWLNNGPWYLAN